MKTVREEGLDWDVQQAQGPLYKIHSQMNHQGLRDLRQFVGNQHAETWSVTGSTQLITSRRGKNEGHIWRTGIDLRKHQMKETGVQVEDEVMGVFKQTDFMQDE